MGIGDCDLSYPILSSEPSLRENIKNKYDLLQSDKYHSGHFIPHMLWLPII